MTGSLSNKDCSKKQELQLMGIKAAYKLSCLYTYMQNGWVVPMPQADATWCGALGTLVPDCSVPGAPFSPIVFAALVLAVMVTLGTSFTSAAAAAALCVGSALPF